MKLFRVLVIAIVIAIAGFGYYQFTKKETPTTKEPSATPPQVTQAVSSPTPFPNTQSAIEAFLANKYNKPISDVHVTVTKEVMGFASGSVMFGQGGPGEGGMWLAVLGNEWEVVWDGNGNVDCNKMRQTYGFPDTILKPNFCS